MVNEPSQTGIKTDTNHLQNIFLYQNSCKIYQWIFTMHLMAFTGTTYRITWHKNSAGQLKSVSDRLQNSCIFCERERRTIFEQKAGATEKNGEGEWWETQACEACALHTQGSRLRCFPPSENDCFAVYVAEGYHSMPLLNSDFCSMRELDALLIPVPPGWDASSSEIRNWHFSRL